MSTLAIDRRNRILMNEMLETIKKIDIEIDESKVVSAKAKAFIQSERNRVYVDHGKEDRREANP